MASLLDRAIRFARSPQGRRLAERARQASRDPETRRRVHRLRARLTGTGTGTRR